MHKRIIIGVLTALCVVASAFYLVCFTSLSLYTFGAIEGSQRFKALDAARSSAPYLSDFLRLFPNAVVNYRYFTTPDEPGYDVSVDLYERYDFEMQLPVQFDTSRRNVVGYGQPQFYLWEVASVKRREFGTGEISYSGGTNFYAAGWRKIVEKNGDFGAIGFIMITNQPVAGFRDRNIEKQP
jgi:hypothetical protein